MMISSIFLLSLSCNCPNVELQTNPPVNLTEYTRATWYIQEQQVNGYQQQEDLYCVAATYNRDNNSKVPFFKGNVLSVYNYANFNETNGISLNNSTVLCARQPNNSEPEKLLVAPCFLPNIFGGPYWILAAGPSPQRYDWAVVIGGQPSVRVSNTTCTTKLSGINNSGLWIFSRERVLDNSTLSMVRDIVTSKNVSIEKLLPVNQTGCYYRGAFIKS